MLKPVCRDRADAAVMIAGVYFNFSPVIPIFIILGFGLSGGVTRIGRPVVARRRSGRLGRLVTGSICAAKTIHAQVTMTSCGGGGSREGDGFR